MKTLKKTSTALIHRIGKCLIGVKRPQGNVLLYIVLVMVIFGLLGATMVSLFTASTVSTATLNEDRRAHYLYESAARYAMSELRNNDFASTRIDALDTTIYTLNPPGTFEFDIYSLWFRSNETKTIPATLPTISVSMDEGELPGGFSFPGGNVFAVNLESTHIDPVSGKTQIPDPTAPNNSGVITVTSIGGSAPNYIFNVIGGENFAVSEDERIGLAVRPTTFQSLSAGSDLKVHENARFIFPKYNGAVFIKTGIVYYDEAVHYPGSRVELTNLSTAITASSADYVILWPTNHVVIPTADTTNVSYGGSEEYAVNVADTGDLMLGKYGSAGPDIDNDEFIRNQNEKESGPTDYIERDLVNKDLTIGDGGVLSGEVFGGTWYDANKSVGGYTKFCDTGECQFGVGIRVFFTFEYSGTGDGFIFSIVNGAENSVNSIGGDIQASELLGYAGDSRLLASPGTPPSANFLDTDGRGLQPPKIGLEFDTRTNFSSTIEETLAYCASATDLNLNSRNDPLTSDRDAVQYVFWGRDGNINIPCRDPSPGRDTYDDNRHNALGFASGDWSENLSGDARSSPIVGPDGTIYAGSDASRVFAINPDGTREWFATTASEVRTAPALSPDGSSVYATDLGGTIYAFNASTGNLLWSEPLFGSQPTKPVVDSNGIIFVGAGQRLLKVDPARPPGFKVFAGFDPAGTITVTAAPALSPDESVVYVGFSDGSLFARDTSDFSVGVWNRSVFSAPVDAPVVDPVSGVIYVSSGSSVRKINPATGSDQWVYTTTSNVTSAPTLSRDRETVYVGYNNRNLLALNTDDAAVRLKWSYTLPRFGSFVGTPTVDSSEHIYFGSDDNYVYALYADGTQKWEYDGPSGDVRTKPAIDGNGFVYVGSDDNQLWAIASAAEPQNYRENFENVPSTSELAKNLVAYNRPEAVDPYPVGFMPTDSDDWLKSGPWAVRMEIIRDPDAGNYLLRAWLRQCGGTGNSCNDILGSFFEDTRITYDPSGRDPNLVQSFNLGGSLNTDFDTFLFGFTSAGTTGDDQRITITNFQLSFIRPGDPVITSDPEFP